jgi:hypothetical protein
MTEKKSIAAPQLAGAQAVLGATILGGGWIDQAALRQEQAAGFKHALLLEIYIL